MLEDCGSHDSNTVQVVLTLPEETGPLDVVIDRTGGRCRLFASIPGTRVDLPEPGSQTHPANFAHALRGDIITAGIDGNPMSFELLDAETGSLIYESADFTPQLGQMNVFIARGTPQDDELIVRGPAETGTDDIIVVNGIDAGPQALLAWTATGEPQVVHDGLDYGEYALFESVERQDGAFHSLRWEDDLDFWDENDNWHFPGPQHPENPLCSTLESDGSTIVLLRTNHVSAGGSSRCWGDL